MPALAPQPHPSQQSWFLGAPVTKVMALASVAMYVFANTKKSHQYLAFDSTQIARYSEYDRYLLGKLTFGTTVELFFSGMLTCTLSRKFERELGSRKFVLMFIFSNLVAMALEFLWVQLDGMTIRYNGPYPFLGALMLMYYRFTPRVHPRFFSFLGFTFSEKTFYYFVFAQVIGYGGWGTTIATIFGATACWLYFSTQIHGKLDVPDVVALLFSKIGERLSEPPPRIMAPAIPTGGRGGGGGAAGAAAAGGPGAGGMRQRLVHPALNPMAAGAAAAAPPVVAPDPAAIEQLTSMGFDRQRVITALQRSDNNVERAADRLLTGS